MIIYIHLAENELEVSEHDQEKVYLLLFPHFQFVQFIGERSALHFPRWFWSGKLQMFPLVVLSLPFED